MLYQVSIVVFGVCCVCTFWKFVRVALRHGPQSARFTARCRCLAPLPDIASCLTRCVFARRVGEWRVGRGGGVLVCPLPKKSRQTFRSVVFLFHGELLDFACMLVGRDGQTISHFFFVTRTQLQIGNLWFLSLPSLFHVHALTQLVLTFAFAVRFGPARLAGSSLSLSTTSFAFCFFFFFFLSGQPSCCSFVTRYMLWRRFCFRRRLQLS